MNFYAADIHWSRGDAPFLDNLYSRRHYWRFDGGIEVPASSSPHLVPVPMSDLCAVDPEEAFVASLASCHMLFFLFFAAKGGFVVEQYHDAALGEMGKDAAGKQAMIRVALHPSVEFAGKSKPSPVEIKDLHHRAHENCFLARSVKADVVCEPLAPVD